MSEMTLTYVIVVLYLLFMLLVGASFRRLNNSADDYFRSGCRGSWWLIGSSAFMITFSAYTFTGAAGVAFESGWTVMIIFWGSSIGFFICYLFLAKWFRQLRQVTTGQITGERFNQTTRYFFAIIGTVNGLLVSALALYTLGIFGSVFLELPLWGSIVGFGIVMVAYSVVGGVWAVMGTDFLQNIILLPLTILLAGICVFQFGGVSGLFQTIEAQGLTSDFRLIKAAGEFPGNMFTFGWVGAMILKNAIPLVSMGDAMRYFSAKDGKAAANGALFASVLFLLGSLIWFIPPITARLLFADEVLALDLAKPAEGAFAIAAMQLLPTGLSAIMGVGIIAATMSSLDTGLNRNAAAIVYDFTPLYCRLTNRAIPSDRSQLVLGQVASSIFGALIIGIALYYSKVGGVGAFSIMINITATLLLPLAVPMVLGTFIRRTPANSALISGTLTLVFSLSTPLLWDWNFQERLFANLIVGSVIFLATIPFRSWSNQEYRSRLDRFFTKMKTPVDFEKEVGQSNDATQLKILGRFVLLFAVATSLVALVSKDSADRFIVMGYSGAVALLGAVMILLSRRSK